MKTLLAMLTLASLGRASPDYFSFVPELSAIINQTSATGFMQSAMFALPCFERTVAHLDLEKSRVTFELNGRRSPLCSDEIVLATLDRFHLHLLVFTGNSTIDIGQWANTLERQYVERHGLSIFLIRGGLSGTLKSIWDTSTLFHSSNPYMIKDNVRFLKNKANITLSRRGGKVSAVMTNEDIGRRLRPGDVLAIRRLDGLDPMIMWGTGSRTGHTAIVLNIAGQLSICEYEGITLPLSKYHILLTLMYEIRSTDKDPFDRDQYWPPPYGIIATPVKQWLQQAHRAKYDVAILPLRYQTQFDNERAVQYFNTVKGDEYGIQNFLFGWLDTPNDNFPGPLNSRLLLHLVAFLQLHAPRYAVMLFLEGLNKRLGTTGLDIQHIIEVLDREKRSFAHLYTMPEQDHWLYNGKPSLVCDSFVIQVLRAGNALGPYANQIQGTEFTPMDLYQVALFDSSNPCANSTDGLPFCQIMGDYLLELPGYNTIPIYPHMNENCASHGPARVIMC